MNIDLHPPPVTDESDPYSPLASHFKAAGDPLRLEILRVLARDSYGVLELSRIFDIKQSGMSHHLKVLATAGLVASRREGNSIFYRRALPGSGRKNLSASRGAVSPTAISDLQTHLYVALDQQPLRREIHNRVIQVQAERTATSMRFFAENAGKFRKQQDLIASFPVYAEQVRELLLNTPLPAAVCALEVGPGEGEFLSTLAPRFERVIALDNASAMLDKSRAYAAGRGLDNIEFIHGEPALMRRRGIHVDCAVINMVLHHTPSPAEIFQDINALLNPGGALLVTDLCRHDQNWARDACGDIWLGFEPEDFGNWAATAGLREGQSVYFALRNGFQIQLRQFFRPASRPSEV